MGPDLIYGFLTIILILAAIILPSNYLMVKLLNLVPNALTAKTKVRPWLYSKRQTKPSRCFCQRETTQLYVISAYSHLIYSAADEVGLLWCNGRMDSWPGSDMKIVLDTQIPLSSLEKLFALLQTEYMQDNPSEWTKLITKWKLRIRDDMVTITLYYIEGPNAMSLKLLGPIYDPVWDILSSL